MAYLRSLTSLYNNLTYNINKLYFSSLFCKDVYIVIIFKILHFSNDNIHFSSQVVKQNVLLRIPIHKN